MMFFSLLAQTETEAGAEALPADLDDVKASLMDTLGGVWADFIDHVPLLIGGFVVIILTWIVAAVARRIVGKIVDRKTQRDSIKQLVLRFVSLIAWSLGLLLAAMVVFPGLTPAKALGALGLLSVAIGLAFKDIFENFFAGILILWRFPFEIGDFIECEGLTGKVERVEIRMTRLRKTTGELVVVPNAFLFKNNVEILTAQPQRRVHLMTGVAYDVDVAEAVKVIEGAVKVCSTVDEQKPIQVWPTGFGDSSIDIEVTYWTDPKPADLRRSKGETVIAIKEALDNAGIEIPFPYRTLTFKEPLPIERNTAEASA